MIVALIVMALNATAAIIMLAQSRRSARLAAIVALDVAKRALDRNEMGALQRARLANVRPLIGLPKGKP